MRIKLFENFKKQYEEITQYEFCIIVYGTNDTSPEDESNFLHLTSYEKKVVESFFPSHPVQYDGWLEWEGSCIIPDFAYRKAIFIDKFDDDWFLVSVPKNDTEEKYFKCDQFEGLLELLRDILNYSI